MPDDVCVPQVRASVMNLPSYQTAKRAGRNGRYSRIIDLSSNESPFAPSPKVLAAIRSVDPASFRRYPDADCEPLLSSLANELSISKQQLCFGNGSLQVMQRVAQGFLTNGDEVLISQYLYQPAGLMCESTGASLRVIKSKNFSHNLPAIAASIGDATKAIILANPNNPTGTAFDEKALCEFLNSIPKHILVVIDEAYREYFLASGGFDCLQLLPQFENLFLIRTFSKAYALAGLRVGYGIANQQLMQALKKIQLPFTLNRLSAIAAHAALSEQAYRDKQVAMTLKLKHHFTAKLDEMGINYIPSFGNFVCLNFGTVAEQVLDYLGSLQIYIRPISAYKLDQFLRVSIGLETEMNVLIKALGGWQHQQGDRSN